MTTEKPRLGVDPLGWIGAAQEKPARKTSPASRRAATRTPEKTRTTEAGLPSGWTRATFIVREEHVEKLKGLSYFEDRTLKELMDEALSSYLRGKKVQTRGGK